MSKAKKLKKVKKGMNPETKQTLSNCFRGIISNQACVDGGKESPWWVAVIFLCLSIMLPLIPIMVNVSNTYGASILNGYNYGVDEGLEQTLKDAKDENYTFTINGSLMSFEQNGTPAVLENDPKVPLETDYINDGESYQTINFLLYITDLKGNELQKYINSVSAQKFIIDTITPGDPTVDPEGTKYYTPSFIVFATDTMCMAMYKHGTTTMAGATYGGLTWNNTPNGDLITRLYKEGDTKTDVLNHFKGLLNETFIDQKGINFRNNTLIYFGVYTGLILFLGLLVFVLTRGKRNVFNYLTFFTCQRIAWWASFTPALLGMIFAFIFSTNVIGQMSFVIFLALRIMWMSMRQLRPVQ